ncbi:RDD family protein [Massilia sp. B-10]|nr:RDD family protein [Massilia sp. B-10]
MCLGLWPRIAASLIDFLIVLPLVVLEFYLDAHTRWSALYTLLPYELLTLFLYVFMVGKWGASPGKMLMGMRIEMMDGTRATWKASMLRYVVYWVLGLMISAADIVAAFAISDDAYQALSETQQLDALAQHAPWWGNAALIAISIWAFSCLVMLLANKRRRTLYDVQAGTIVVRTR